MSWNYRVCVTREKDLVNPDEWVFDFTVRDVYYTDEGKPKGYGADPQFPYGEEFTDLLATFKLMAEAMSKPVLYVCDVTEELKEEPTDGDWCYVPHTDSKKTATKISIEEQNKNFRRNNPGHPGIIQKIQEGQIMSDQGKEQFEELKREMERISAERKKMVDEMQLRAGRKTKVDEEYFF